MAVAENPGNWNCLDLDPALVLDRGQVVPAVQAGVQVVIPIFKGTEFLKKRTGS